jgi:hypothetical protein
MPTRLQNGEGRTDGEAIDKRTFPIRRGSGHGTPDGGVDAMRMGNPVALGPLQVRCIAFPRQPKSGETAAAVGVRDGR